MPDTECGFQDLPNGNQVLIYSGPTISVSIGFDPSWVAGSATDPVPAITDVEALVDTGAAQSCIDNLLATVLQLPAVDRREIAGIAGKYKTNIYLAQIAVPALNIIQYGTFAGVDLVVGGQPHQALLGRTFLKDLTMEYDGKSGRVKIST